MDIVLLLVAISPRYTICLYREIRIFYSVKLSAELIMIFFLSKMYASKIKLNES